MAKGKKKPQTQELKLFIFQDVFPHLEGDRGHHGLAAGEIGEVPSVGRLVEVCAVLGRGLLERLQLALTYEYSLATL